MLKGPNRRLSSGLVVSLLVHALLLSLSFGEGFDLPGLELPWQTRRGEVPDVTVVLEPAPTPAAQGEPEPPTDATTVEPTAPSPLPEGGVATVSAPREPEAAPQSQPEPQVEEPRQPTEDEPQPETSSPVIALTRSEIPIWRVPAAAVALPRQASSYAPELLAPLARRPAVEAPLLSPQPDPAEQERARQQRLAQEQARQEQARLAALRAQQAANEAAAAAAASAARAEAERQEKALQQAAAERARQVAAAASAAEAAARQEAARQEAARQEAARQEAARQEASARQEAARQQQESARQEAARRDAARAEAERQAAAAAAAQQAAAQQAAAQQAAAQQAAAAAAQAASAAVASTDEARREARLRAIGKQLDAEAAARRKSEESGGNPRRGRLFGRSDANGELVLYAEAWARKIELNQTFDLVREALTKQPHVEPLVTVAVRADGSVESIAFVRSSGSPALDEAIRRVIQSQEHYAPFPPSLAREYDVVEIRRSWHFDTAIRLY